MFPYPPTYFVTYSAIHSCGTLAQRSDYRIKFKEDLGYIRVPLLLHCPRCQDELQATHIEIARTVNLGVEWVVRSAEIVGFDAATVVEG